MRTTAASCGSSGDHPTRSRTDCTACGLEWIGFQRESQRHYPKGSLAAHVLGSVDFEEKGNAGIEKSLDEDLRGQPGQMRLLTDVKRRGIESHPGYRGAARPAVTLTIDERIQFVAERELAAAVQAHHATSGSVVVMNPYTGEILALASYPTYDPNDAPKPEDVADRQNHAVSVPFEPGSVFKVITLSAALETTTLTPDSLINCHGGVLRLARPRDPRFARRAGRHSHGDGAGEIQQHRRHRDRHAGGAGQYVRLRPPLRIRPEDRHRPARPNRPDSSAKLSRWGKTSLASVSMGQEVSVTTLQLAQAAASSPTAGCWCGPAWC